MNVREFTDANDDANKFKNRLANALPCKLYPLPAIFTLPFLNLYPPSISSFLPVTTSLPSHSAFLASPSLSSLSFPTPLSSPFSTNIQLLHILLFPPDNYNRVHLMMSPGVGGSDFINASYIDVSSSRYPGNKVYHNLSWLCRALHAMLSKPRSQAHSTGLGMRLYCSILCCTFQTLSLIPRPLPGFISQLWRNSNFSTAVR